jgi:hypothetical protein
MIIGVFVIVGIMYVLGWALEKDLKKMETTNPKLREHIRQKYSL